MWKPNFSKRNINQKVLVNPIKKKSAPRIIKLDGTDNFTNPKID